MFLPGVGPQLLGERRWRQTIRQAAGVKPSSDAATSSFTADNYVREHIKNLKAYTPIKPFEILSREMDRDPADIVKLDANENPYGAHPSVLEALGTMQFPNIYPDPSSTMLREALEEYTSVSKDHLLVGCGCDELIDLLMRVVLDPGDGIVDCPPTFTMYAFDARANNARIVTVERNASFGLNLPQILHVIKKYRPKIVFVTSPNNPDGSLVTEEELATLLEQPVLVVLDEAYIEFSDHPSRITEVPKHSNLVVLRTFSKSAGLAGLRVGYGAFPLDLVEFMLRAKQPYNVSVAAETAAVAALQQQDYMQETRDKLVQERERLIQGLWEVPFLTTYNSHANFVLCKVHSPWQAGKVKQNLQDRFGILVRYYGNTRHLQNYIRISVGKPEHNDALLQGLHKLA